LLYIVMSVMIKAIRGLTGITKAITTSYGVVESISATVPAT